MRFRKIAIFFFLFFLSFISFFFLFLIFLKMNELVCRYSRKILRKRSP